VLLVIDTQKGVTPQDEEVARLLRERVLGDRGTREGRKKKGKKGSRDRGTEAEAQGTENGAAKEKQRNVRVIVVANKCDGPKWEAHAVEASALGFGDPIPVAAKNN